MTHQEGKHHDKNLAFFWQCSTACIILQKTKENMNCFDIIQQYILLLGNRVQDWTENALNWEYTHCKLWQYFAIAACQAAKTCSQLSHYVNSVVITATLYNSQDFLKETHARRLVWSFTSSTCDMFGEKKVGNLLYKQGLCHYWFFIWQLSNIAGMCLKTSDTCRGEICSLIIINQRLQILV